MKIGIGILAVVGGVVIIRNGIRLRHKYLGEKMSQDLLSRYDYWVVDTALDNVMEQMEDGEFTPVRLKRLMDALEVECMMLQNNM